MVDHSPYGKTSNPVNQGPFERIVEVHWGGTFGVLTIDRAANTSYTLDPDASVLLGPYDSGATIPRADWTDKTVAGIQFNDNASVGVVHPDGFNWSTSNFYVDSGHRAKNPGPVPERGSLTDDDYSDGFFANVLSQYWAYKAAYDAVWAPYIGNPNPNFLFVEAADSRPYFNGQFQPVPFDGSLRIPKTTDPNEYVYEHQVYNPNINTGGDLVFDFNSQSYVALQQWNKYSPAVSTTWPILRVKLPYDELDAFRFVYLIDFKKLEADFPSDPTVKIGQSVTFTDPNIVSWNNTFSLKIYGSSDFKAGAARTVTSTATPSYSVTKTLPWNTVGSNLLSFKKTGWL